MRDQPRYSTFRDYLAVIRQRRLTIVFVTMLFIGAAVLYAVGTEPVYEAEAAIEVREPSTFASTIGIPEPARQTPQERATTAAETALSPEVLRAAERRLGGRVRLTDNVRALAEVRTNFVVITARSGSARDAARRAQAVADEFIRQRDRDIRVFFDDLIKSTRQQVRREFRRRRGFDELRRSIFEDQIVRLEAAREISDPATLARRAEIPDTPVSPRPVLAGAASLLVGLVFGLLLAFGRDALDRRLRGSRDITEATNLPVLGLVRRGALGKANVGDPIKGRGEDEIDLEAFRIVRTNLEFLDVDKGVKTVVVTSPLPAEGKSTVAASLAVATALAGKRVLLVDADLRRPVLAERFGLGDGAGLTDYLAGRAGPQEVLKTVSLGTVPTANGKGPTNVERTLVVIPAGTGVPRPAELLASDRLAAFVEEVGGVYDMVVFDSSPLLPVSDTLELIPRLDAVILCVRSGQTTRDQLAAARHALGRLPDRPTGIVVTGVKKGDDGEYGYYSYSYAYASSE